MRDEGGLSEIYQSADYMEYLTDVEAEAIAGFFLDVITSLGVNDRAAPVLDFGAGRCTFQHFFQEWGWTAFESLEPNAGSREAAKRNYGLVQGVHGSINGSMHGKYKIVLANMVLEHLEDPIATVRESILPLLRHDGFAVIAVPHVDSLNRLICGPFWIGYSSDQHNWFFGRRSAEIVMTRAGLLPLQIAVKSALFTRRDRWRPPSVLKRLYKHTMMRFAESVSRGDQLMIVAKRA